MTLIFIKPVYLQRKLHVTVASEPERIGVFLTRSCVHVTDISCGVVYEATLASLVLFRSYCYVSGSRGKRYLKEDVEVQL